MRSNFGFFMLPFSQRHVIPEWKLCLGMYSMFAIGVAVGVAVGKWFL